MKEILNEIWKGGKVPDEWKIGTVKPIFKKERREEVGNYRGITLMDTWYKIYAEILRKRLEKEIKEKEILDRTQMGFREGKGIAKAIYALKEAIESGIKKERGKVIVGFADMKAAFDRLKRENIWESMRKKGVGNRLIRRIKELFEETKVRIQIGEEQIDEVLK